MKFSSGGNVLTGAGATGGSSGATWRGFDPTAKRRHWAVPSFYETLMPASYLELDVVGKLEALYQAGLVEIREGVAWPIMVRYLDEREGVPVQDIWAYQPYTQDTVWGSDDGVDEDVAWLGPTDPDRLGYPTQKPEGLLARIIAASSNEGDIVLDPFCGCGTAVHAAQRQRRQWIGIDITHLAIGLIAKRLDVAFPGVKFAVHGAPSDMDGARALAAADKHEFQLWAVWKIGAVPFKGGKKGADGGIDGLIYFKPDHRMTERAVVSVKGGENVGVGMVRDLGHVVERERAKIGVFVTLTEATRPMLTEATKAGFYQTDFGSFPRMQVLPVAEIFSGRLPQTPPVDRSAFRRPVRADTGIQGSLLM